MAALMSCFPVLMEIKIQPFSHWTACCFDAATIINMAAVIAVTMERSMSSSDSNCLPGQDIGPKNPSWSNDCFRVYLS